MSTNDDDEQLEFLFGGTDSPPFQKHSPTSQAAAESIAPKSAAMRALVLGFIQGRKAGRQRPTRSGRKAVVWVGVEHYGQPLVDVLEGGPRDDF